MAAADALLVPSRPKTSGPGDDRCLESAALVRGDQPGPGLLGYLISMYQGRRTLHRRSRRSSAAVHGPAVFDATIPESVDYAEAVTALKPVGFHKPKGAAAKAVRAVAEESWLAWRRPPGQREVA